MILDLEIGGTVLSGKQNEINKTAAQPGTKPCAAFAAFSDTSYYFMCLPSATRVNIFGGSTPFVSRQLFVYAEGRRSSGGATFDLNFREMQRSPIFLSSFSITRV